MKTISKEDPKNIIIIAQYGAWKSIEKMPLSSINIKHVYLVDQGVTNDNWEELYYDSKGVLTAALDILENFNNIESITPIAKPILHLWKCNHLVKKTKYKLAKTKIGKIRFDPESLQWWTRSQLNIIIYSFLHFFGIKPKVRPYIKP